MSRESEAEAVIMAYACANATVGALLANTLVGDAIVLAPLFARMTGRLAGLCGKNPGSGSVSDLVVQLFGSASGAYLGGKLLAWIPFAGNQVNAESVFEITQVVGWAAFGMLDSGMPRKEAVRFGKSRKMTAGELQAVLGRMAPPDRARYEGLKRVIGNPAAPRPEKTSAAREMGRLVIGGRQARLSASP